MQQFQVQQGAGYAPYKVNWNSFEAQNAVPPAKFAALEADKAQEKMDTVSSYVKVLGEFPPFPETRGCKDVIFALLFFVCVAGMSTYLAMNWSELQDFFDEINKDFSTGITAPLGLMLPMAAGAGGTMLMTALFILMMRVMPGCVVWTSLLLGPTLTIAMGGAIIVAVPDDGLILGLILIALGCCSLMCLFMCWREFIPFTIQLCETIAIVLQQIPCTTFIAFIGGTFGFFWATFTILTVLASRPDMNAVDQRSFQAGFTFVMLWGMMISTYYTHTILCGIFGRWYYSKDQGSEVSKSIALASTSHFGSICTGAFIIAAIRTLEIMLRSMEKQAAEEGNAALMILICIIRVCVSCIGDIVEYISEWAYVQVAVRGTSFCDSAKATYALLTLGNMQFVLSDLLIDSVSSMASLLCFAAGVGFGILGNASNWDTNDGVAAGAMLGLIPAIMIAGTAGNVISAGSKTILASWAEDSECLAKHRPDLHQAFHEKMVHKFNEMGASDPAES